MIFYLLLIFLCCGLCMLKARSNVQYAISRNTVHRHYFDYYNAAVGLLLIFSIIRESTLGADSPNYIRFFNEALEGNYPSYELGFLGLTIFAQFFSENYQFFIALCSLIVLVSMLYVIRRETTEYHWLAIFIFITSQYVATFSILRGYLALAFVFLAYRHIKDRSKVTFWIFMLIAVLFHNSAAIFAPLLLLCRKRYKLYHYFFIFVFCIIFSIPSIYMGIIQIITELNPRYIIYSESINNEFSIVHMLFFAFFSMLCAAYYKSLLQRNSKNIILINLCVASLFISITFTWFPAVSRVIVNCMSFICILAPEIVACEKDIAGRRILSVFICIIFAVYMILNVSSDYLTVFS